MGTHAPNGDAKLSSSVGLQCNPESFLSACRCCAQYLWRAVADHAAVRWGAERRKVLLLSARHWSLLWRTPVSLYNSSLWYPYHFLGIDRRPINPRLSRGTLGDT